MPELEELLDNWAIPPVNPQAYVPSVHIEGGDDIGYKRKIVDRSKTVFDITKIGDYFGIRDGMRVSEAHMQKFVYANPQYQALVPYQFKDKDTLVGIEVEVENILRINPDIPLCFWQIENDGSLRNHGKEFKTCPTPLRHTESALMQLFSGLNPDVDFSKRTSIHVHVDVRQLTLSQITGVLFTYAAVENLLFKFAAADRRGNIFCVPITETNLLCQSWKDPIEMYRQIDHVWQKYTALNLLPLQRFGTLEFRQMPGTSNIRKLLIWMDMLTRIRVFAYRYPLPTIVSMISELNTSSRYRAFVESVFEELVQFLDLSSLPQDMEKPCYRVKISSATNQFHQRVCQSKDLQTSFGKLFADNPFIKLSKDQKRSVQHLSSVYRTGLKGLTAYNWLMGVANQILAEKSDRATHLLFILGKESNPWNKGEAEKATF